MPHARPSGTRVAARRRRNPERARKQDSVRHSFFPPQAGGTRFWRGMQPSVFNVRVPLPNRDDVFLMNTLTDAQLIVSPDVTALLDRIDGLASLEALSGEERETADLLHENGFLVADRQSDHRALDRYFA